MAIEEDNDGLQWEIQAYRAKKRRKREQEAREREDPDGEYKHIGRDYLDMIQDGLEGGKDYQASLTGQLYDGRFKWEQEDYQNLTRDARVEEESSDDPVAKE